MKFLSFLTGLLSGDSSVSNANDLELDIVKFEPPDGSTLMAGEQVKVTVHWRHSMRGRGVGIWTKPEPPDGVGGSYEGDVGEARQPGQGRVLRSVSLSDPGTLRTVLLVAKDGHSRELFKRRIPVNFTFVENPEREARRQDGIESRITSVTIQPPSGQLPIGSYVEIQVGYSAQSTHGLRVTALPVTDCDMRYAPSAEAANGDGQATQGFSVGETCTIRQVSVRLLNDSDSVVDQRMVDVDLRFGR